MSLKNINIFLLVTCLSVVFAGCDSNEGGENEIINNFRRPNFPRDPGSHFKPTDYSPYTPVEPNVPLQNNPLWDNIPPTQNNPWDQMFTPQNENGKSIFRVYKDNEINRTFDDVAGLEEPKKSLADIVNYLKDPVKFKRLGATPPAGVVFYGPPGTGKTEMARALAGEVAKIRKVTFIVASGASFENKYVGVGASNVRKLFDLARANKPAIIFIDEFDAVAGTRSGEKKNAQVVTQLLTELDGFDKDLRDEIFVIAATNLLEDLDKAVIRPGRFDRKIEIGLPDDKARKAILEHYLALEPAITGINVERLVRATRDWSTAELKTLVNEARIHATSRDAASVSDKDFPPAFRRVAQGRRN